jgi:hypothetical protein
MPVILDDENEERLVHYLSKKDHLIFSIKIGDMGDKDLKKFLKILDLSSINLDPVKELDFGTRDLNDKLFILLGTVILHKIIKSTEYNSFHWRRDFAKIFCSEPQNLNNSILDNDNPVVCTINK